MPQQIPDDLGDLAGEASAICEMVEQALRYTPRQVEATDPTGTVCAVLDATGSPAALRIAEDWQSSLAPEDFPAAVSSAFDAASRQWLAEWNEALGHGGWSPRPGSSVPGPGYGYDLSAYRGQVQPRPLNEVTEDVLNVLDTIGTYQPEPPSGDGDSEGRQLHVRISASGAVTCWASDRWLAEQDSEQLTAEFDAALRRARAQLAGAASGRDLNDRLDGLFDEALALLSAPVGPDQTRGWQR
jgi:hypothetical protein